MEFEQNLLSLGKVGRLPETPMTMDQGLPLYLVAFRLTVILLSSLAVPWVCGQFWNAALAPED